MWTMHIIRKMSNFDKDANVLSRFFGQILRDMMGNRSKKFIQRLTIIVKIWIVYTQRTLLIGLGLSKIKLHAMNCILLNITIRGLLTLAAIERGNLCWKIMGVLQALKKV